MRKNSVKNTRINAEVQRELSTLIREECKDPRIHPLTSVVAAEVAPDLKTAKIYISVLGDEEARKDTYKGLDYNYMEAYIKKNNNELMSEYNRLRGLNENSADNLANPYKYAQMRKWFLEQFPTLKVQKNETAA